MKNYIDTLLLKYNNTQPHKPQHAPHKHYKIIYDLKEQHLPEDDIGPPLDTTGIKYIKGIVCSLLYYAWAVDVALSNIS